MFFAAAIACCFLKSGIPLFGKRSFLHDLFSKVCSIFPLEISFLSHSEVTLLSEYVPPKEIYTLEFKNEDSPILKIN